MHKTVYDFNLTGPQIYVEGAAQLTQTALTLVLCHYSASLLPFIAGSFCYSIVYIVVYHLIYLYQVHTRLHYITLDYNCILCSLINLYQVRHSPSFPILGCYLEWVHSL